MMKQSSTSSAAFSAIALLLALGTTAPAGADKLGIIGDSLSTAMSANDDCSGISGCLAQIREDRRYSFAGGEQPWSLSRRLAAFGVDDVVDQSRNGARWDDALGQAQRIVEDDQVRYVSIELGGNDVCRDAGETLPNIAAIDVQIEQTLTLLSDRLTPGSTVLLAETPDVVQLYQLLRERPHFLFENCQALWNLDAGRLSDNAVRTLCANVLPDANCDSPLTLALARPLVAELFEETFASRFGAEFPCGKVLAATSSDADRAEAAAFNRELNTLLAAKADRFDGRNGVAVRFADNVYTQRFDRAQVSALDCFHPSRAGQRLLADTIWQGLDLNRAGTDGDDLFEDHFESR